MAPSAKYNRSKGLDSQQIEQVLEDIFADEDSGDTDIMMNEQSDNNDDDVATENNASNFASSVQQDTSGRPSTNQNIPEIVYDEWSDTDIPRKEPEL